MLLYEPKPVHKDVEFNYCKRTANLPEPYMLIDEKTWRRKRHAWAVHYTEFEQIKDRDVLIKIFGKDIGRADAHIEYFGDYAVAEIIECNSRTEDPMVRFIQIGCEHDWEIIDRDKFSETRKCKICGTIIEIPQGD